MAEHSMTTCVRIGAIGKPRQTRQDKWKKRPPVVRYRAWQRQFLLLFPLSVLPKDRGQCYRVDWKAYLKIPKSRLKDIEPGSVHQQKPDRDNIDKAILDSLFPKDDSHIAVGLLEKYWDDGDGERLEITVHWK